MGLAQTSRERNVQSLAPPNAQMLLNGVADPPRRLKQICVCLAAPPPNWRTPKGNGALPNVRMKDVPVKTVISSRHSIFAEFNLGRIALHLLCAGQDKNFPWHWRGILRGISQGALLVSPASKRGAAEKWFDNSSLGESLRNAATVRRHRSAGNNAILGRRRPLTD